MPQHVRDALAGWATDPELVRSAFARVSVPIDGPTRALMVALPRVKPRSVLLLLSVTVVPPDVSVVGVAAAAFIAGSARLPVGGETLAMLASVELASWPTNFWPVSKVTGPVYDAALS